MAANVILPAEGANNGPPNSLAGFEGALGGGGKRVEKGERKGKGRKGAEGRGENTPPIQINFWLLWCGGIVATARRPSPVIVTRLMNDSSTGSLTTHPIFYTHFYHHGAIDTTRFGNERMTWNFLIVHQNLEIKTF